jgi:hypothetical protein
MIKLQQEIQIFLQQKFANFPTVWPSQDEVVRPSKVRPVWPFLSALFCSEKSACTASEFQPLLLIVVRPESALSFVVVRPPFLLPMHLLYDPSSSLQIRPSQGAFLPATIFPSCSAKRPHFSAQLNVCSAHTLNLLLTL